MVHGADGIDEISTTGYTKISECRDGAVNTFYLHPADVGLPKAPPASLKRRRRRRRTPRIIDERARRASAGRRATSCCSTPARRCSSPARPGRFEEGMRARGARHRPRRRARGRSSGSCRFRRPTNRRRERAHDAGVRGAARICSRRSSRRRAASSRCARRASRSAVLARRAERATPRPGALPRGAQPDRIASTSIAECKRRSPSRGVLRADYDPVAIARGYAAAGAAAISVLTEPTFFDGVARASRRRCARRWTSPLLRKDFIVSEYQLLEARAAGADAVLLIVAALDARRAARACRRAAAALGLDALVEVHDARRAGGRASTPAPTIIGVNNRNLRTLAVDVRRVRGADRADAAGRRRGERERPEDRRRSSAAARRSATARF